MEVGETEHGGCRAGNGESDNGSRGRTAESSTNDVTPPVELWTSYGKTSGHANMTGELFEVKMAALLYVRGLNRTGDFWLTSNMSSAELFDDLTFVHRDEHANMRAACLQLKHKQTKVGEGGANSRHGSVTEFGCVQENKGTKCIDSQSLMALSGNFSLVSYLHSFIKVKKNHGSHKDLSIIPTFSNIQFVLYTNANVARSVLDDVVEVDGGDLFTTGGKVYKIDPEGKISLGMKELFNLKVFLTNLKRDIDALPMCEKEELIKVRVNAYTGRLNGDLKEYQQLKTKPCLKEVERILSLKVLQFDCEEEVVDEFINNLLICTGQTSESELETLIKTEIEMLCKYINEVDLNIMYDDIVKHITSWWRYDNAVLNSKSKIWIDSIHAYVSALGRSRSDELKGFKVEFLDKSTEMLTKTINESRLLVVEASGELTALSTIKVLSILQPTGIDLHGSIFVNLDAFRKQSEKIFSAWKSKWFNTLILECELDETSVPYAELGNEIRKISESLSKRIVIIAKKGHSMTEELKRMTICNNTVDNSCWGDLTVTSQNFLRLKKVNFQGVFVVLDNLIGDNKQLASKLDGVSLNLLLSGALSIGKELNKTNELYVPRKLGNGDDFIHSLSDVPEKVVLITGEPGIGKTSLINKLANSTKEKDSSLWIISLSMTECEDYLEEVNLKDVNRKMCVDFLKKFTTYSNTAFEDELFNHCIKTDKMIVLLDAIDEVSPNYGSKLVLILEHFREMGFRALWATSRLGMQGTIERVLKVASKQLVYFSREDQANLLKAFWKSRNPDVDEESFVNITTAFWKLTSMTFIDKSLLTGIPQLTIMLAETFEKELFHKKLNAMQFQPKSLDLLQLYDAFVRKKHDMYFKSNKTEQDKNFEIFMNKHMHAAVWTLFSKYDYAGLVFPNRDLVEIERETFCEEIRKGLEKTGIIDGFSTTMNRPRFMHRTFCEYFAAKWIAKNFKGNSDFLMNKMFHSSFKIVNVLLNRILANGHDLHICVLNRDLKGIGSLLHTKPESIHETDQGGRTAFHLVTLMWDRNRHSDYVNMARILLEHGASINSTEAVLNLRPLEIADKTMAWTIAGLILQHDGDVHDLKTTENNMNNDVFEEFIEFLGQPEGNVAELLTTATKHDDKYLIRYLVEECNADVNCPGENGATLMHWAAYGGHINLMAYLRKNGGSYLALDINLNLPLHYAASHGGKNAVEFLVDHGSEVDAVNSSSETPLLIAAGSVDADLEVIKYLIMKGANINACNNDDLSSLYLSVESGKIDTVRYLCNAMQTIDVERFGQASFQCAIEKNDWRIVNYLRDEAKISLPKTVLPFRQLFSLAIKVMFFITVLICTVFSFKHLLDAVPQVFSPDLYNTLKFNATNTFDDHFEINFSNGTSLIIEGHPFLPSVSEGTKHRLKTNAIEEMFTNSTRIVKVWFVDYKLSVSQDVIWKVILNALTLIFVSLNLGWSSFLVYIGLLSWSLGLILSAYSVELSCLLVAGFSWAVIFFTANQGTCGFQGNIGKFFNQALNVSGVFLWTLSFVYTSNLDMGLVLIVLGAIKVTIGISWRHQIPFESRFYNVFLTLHTTCILCAVWFSWIRESDWPTWFTWSSRLVLAVYVAGVITFVRIERLLPTSLEKALKTKIKLRFAWLLLLVPVWAYVSVTENHSWARWLGMLVVPLPVFTLFFEWGRHQLLMSDRKT